MLSSHMQIDAGRHRQRYHTDQTLDRSPSSPGCSTNQHGQGENIHVVVRCRGRNQREIDSKNQIAVDIPREVSNKVVIRPSDTLNISKQMTTARTYTVDDVFGAEASQERFYTEVAGPVCDEFVKGYNCTIFSYGQTGAGKTFTMCGDLNGSELQRDAGIVPRILSQLFTTISHQSRCIVKCSYVEIYNEELNDLLTSSSKKRRLRIYEQRQHGNSTKRIAVDGLEEFQIKNIGEAMKYLRRGMKVRQTASTLMNNRSSRSHSIFTITLTRKLGQGDDDGDYRQSKMNLVDLAGSENIIRTGSIKKRAKEAGSINQSLLTLGRVITCLSDGNGYIPYRESNLTRLLQDSLGGETKTVLIANISPVREDIQSTMSTLEYASKAKNIKNAIQFGPLISSKNLVQKLLEENYRLNLDLTATQKKEGIYMDSGNYKELITNLNNATDEVKELRLKGVALEDEMKAQTARADKETAEREKCSTKLTDIAKELSICKSEYEKEKAAHLHVVESANNLTAIMNKDIEDSINYQRKLVEFFSHLEELQQSVGSTADDSKNTIIGLGHFGEDMSKQIEETITLQKNIKNGLDNRLMKLKKMGTNVKELQKNLEELDTECNAMAGKAAKEASDMYSFISGDAFATNQSQLVDELLMFTSSRIKQFQSEFAASFMELIKGLTAENTSNLRQIFKSRVQKRATVWHKKTIHMMKGISANRKAVLSGIDGMSTSLKDIHNSYTTHLASVKTGCDQSVERLIKSKKQLGRIGPLQEKLRLECENSNRKLQRCSNSIKEMNSQLKNDVDGRIRQLREKQVNTLSQLGQTTKQTKRPIVKDTNVRCKRSRLDKENLPPDPYV